MPSAGTNPTRAQAARSLGLSGSLERRIAHLERSIPEGPIWVPAGSGLPHVYGDGIRKLLTDARRHLQARRWAAAMSAYENAEHLVDRGKPTLRLALERQAEARRQESETQRRSGLRLGSKSKQSSAERIGRRYTKLARKMRVTAQKRGLQWSVNSIVNEIRRHHKPPRGLNAHLSARQIRRHLNAHGVK